jgi:hypothetical protein
MPVIELLAGLRRKPTWNCAEVAMVVNLEFEMVVAKDVVDLELGTMRGDSGWTLLHGCPQIRTAAHRTDFTSTLEPNLAS